MEPIMKLFQYFNEESQESTYYTLVEFTLNHIKQLPELSISDFSEKTFVSKATITRFTHFLGFDSYKSFKKYFQVIGDSSRNSFLRMSAGEVKRLMSEPTQFFYDYTEQIIRSLEDTRQTVKTEEVDLIVQAVVAASKVTFVGYSDSSYIATDIQLGCLAAGKLVEVPKTQVKFKEIATTYTDKDLVVILSNYGNFFHLYNDFYQSLLKRKVPVILITQNYYSMDSFAFKQTLYLCSQRHLNVGNYPLRLFSDYFVRRFVFHVNH
ncbi:MurR/RpiR family transcriptional regulator [Granulicatella seriolae]|uniref:MurR/RpiR family transcriptional regulator n=1 Tax=Granulicatella seriolae TaxID=2967226 RepID=A0ABT1WMK2_9LACT|nr:MurR/RpiR family transcriptional regulator [Granulicatella seriolae]